MNAMKVTFQRGVPSCCEHVLEVSQWSSWEWVDNCERTVIKSEKEFQPHSVDLNITKIKKSVEKIV
jgi:hypothetical protein